MIADLIMLIIISSIFFLFLSSQHIEKSVTAGTIRAQSVYTQNLLRSILNYQTPNGTVAELVGADYCIGNWNPTINSSVHQAFTQLETKNSYFIFLYGTTQDRVVFNNASCVRTEQVNLATFDMSLPCSPGSATVSLGYWPKTQVVESC